MDEHPASHLRWKIDKVAKEVRKFYRDENGESYPLHEVRESILWVMKNRGESVLEDNGEILMKNDEPVYDELRELLQGPRRRALADGHDAVLQQELFVESENRHNGYTTFSPAKLEAMVVHLAYRGKRVVPTRLNKLLFYADFSAFALRGRSISGAEYTKLTHGPIISGYRELVNRLEMKRQIRTTTFKTRGRFAKALRAKKTYQPLKSVLSAEELRVLDWVVDTYDHLPTTELIGISHREMAYWDTEWKQSIDYNLAEDLENKPPEDLLDQEK